MADYTVTELDNGYKINVEDKVIVVNPINSTYEVGVDHISGYGPRGLQGIQGEPGLAPNLNNIHITGGTISGVTISATSITASGTISAANLSGTNTGDQDLTSIDLNGGYF
jgi:hypothetical protein